MSEGEHLADAMVGLLSNPEGGWFTPVIIAIQGLSAEQAARVPAERFNSAWGVVNHMSYWLEYLLLRFRGEPVEKLKAAGRDNWTPIEKPYTEEAWQADCDRLFAVNKEFADLVKGLSDEVLDEPYAEGKPKRCQVIQGIIAHNCYHTNEVICIRHMLGYWLENT